LEPTFYRCQEKQCCTLKDGCAKNGASRCGDFRKGTLCGECIVGYSEWGYDCVTCDGVSWGFIMIILGGGIVLVMLLQLGSKGERAAIRENVIQMMHNREPSNQSSVQGSLHGSVRDVLSPDNNVNQYEVSVWLPYLCSALA
jgi:hypothetical protein